MWSDCHQKSLKNQNEKFDINYLSRQKNISYKWPSIDQISCKQKHLFYTPYLIHPFKFNGHLNKTPYSPYISGTDKEQRGGSFY